MTGNPTQERQVFLDALHKSKETVGHAIDAWVETVESVTPIAPSTQVFPQKVVDGAYNFAEDLYACQRRFAEGLPEAEKAVLGSYNFNDLFPRPSAITAVGLPEAEGDVAAAAAGGESSPRPWADGEAQIYTMRELNQRTAEVMREIEEHKVPAFITKHGRFVAMITPLETGQVESRVLSEMARQINKGSGQ
jgi:prevent-host-death family protein